MPTSPGAISPVPCPNTCAIHCLISLSLSDLSDIFIWCIWYLYLIYLYLYLISGNNPGDDDESHRNNPRLIEGYPDFHSVPKLFKADPGMIHLLILTIQDILLNVARPGILFKPISRGGVQPTPLVLQRLVSSQFINCKFPPKFLSEETKVCSAFTWLVLRSVLNMDTKSLPEGGPSGKV